MSLSPTQVIAVRSSCSVLASCACTVVTYVFSSANILIVLLPPLPPSRSSAAAATVEDAQDDLKREMSFYAASLNAVLWAQAECDKLKIPHKVPRAAFQPLACRHMARALLIEFFFHY